MPSPEEWQELLQQAPEPDVIVPHTYLNDRKRSRARPFKVATDRGDFYVKGLLKNQGRGNELAIDQIAGFLGGQISAPVGSVALIELSGEFVSNESEIKDDVEPGIAHATEVIEGCTDKHKTVDHLTAGDNRERFAKLAIFFGWVWPSDAQIIYKKQNPKLVHSVDHGHFLPPGGGRWSRNSLQQHTDPPAPYDRFVREAQLSDDELREAARGLLNAGNTVIAEAVSRLPGDWGISEDERIELARFLAKRRDVLVNTFVSREGNDG